MKHAEEEKNKVREEKKRKAKEERSRAAAEAEAAAAAEASAAELRRAARRGSKESKVIPAAAIIALHSLFLLLTFALQDLEASTPSAPALGGGISAARSAVSKKKWDDAAETQVQLCRGACAALSEQCLTVGFPGGEGGRGREK